MSISCLKVLAPITALLLCGVIPVSVVKADVYKYVDSDGRIHFTDRPTHDGYRLVARSFGSSGTSKAKVDYRNKERNRKRFSSRISTVAKRHGLPGGLIHAVVATESAYDPNAVSRAGAVGLMQLMPETARRYGVTNRRDPAANLSAGARYLKFLLTQFDNDLALALAGYNAGENAVRKYGNKIPPFEETQAYVRKVLKIYQENTAESYDDV